MGVLVLLVLDLDQVEARAEDVQEDHPKAKVARKNV